VRRRVNLSKVAWAFDDFVCDDALHELRSGGVPLKVDGQVLALLEYLLQNPGRLVTKDELLQHVWEGRALGDNVISVCVAKLRNVLGRSSPPHITSVYGRGYRFMRNVRELPSAPATSSPAPTPATRDGAPLVGRTTALARLYAALESARAGRAAVCALLGEAGIGKTRAAEVLEERAQALALRVCWGRCHALGEAPPLWPWLQIVRSAEAQLSIDLGSRAIEEIALPSATAPEHFQRRAADASYQTLGWMTRALLQMCAHGPWLVVLEDMQWADSASLQLLSQLIAEIAQLPLCLLLTVRDTELPEDARSRRALDYVLGQRACERIALSRLLGADVTAYTTALFETAPAALSDAVLAHSQGNPFFMVELLRPWVNGPAPSPDQLQLAGPALEIVRQGLRRLDAATNEVLSAAAVVGSRFELGLLSAITAQDPEALIERLEDAMSTQVIVAAPGSHTHFAFGHDLVRSVLYQDLGIAGRTHWHKRTADALLLRSGPAAPASAELAHHLLLALPSGDARHAIAHARRAAFAAMRLGAYSDASGLLRRALEALALLPAEDARLRCSLLFELAASERGAGQKFFSHFDDAVALARLHAFGDLLAFAGKAMSSGAGTVAMTGASEVLSAALIALPETEHALRASVLSHLSWTAPNSWEQARVQQLIAQAEAEAEAAGAAAGARGSVRSAQLYCAGAPGDQAQALLRAAELEHMAAARGSLARARWSLEPAIARIIAFLQRGELDRAHDALELFGAAARELQHAELIWHYERMRVVLRMNHGEYAYARLRLGELREQAERLQLYARKAVEAIDWGRLLGETVDIRPLAAQLSPALRTDAGDSPVAYAHKLRGLVGLGQLDEVRARLQALPVEKLQALPKNRDYLATLAHLSVAAVATEQTQHAAALYGLLEPYPRLCVASLSLHCYGVVSHFLAILAALLNQRVRASEHFASALAEQQRLNLAPQLARSRYEFARFLAQAGGASEQTQARSLLAQVIEASDALGMQPLAAAARELLASVGA
jgi:DNA-binding winged helix-turn-helix (wHTH) protein